MDSLEGENHWSCQIEGNAKCGLCESKGHESELVHTQLQEISAVTNIDLAFSGLRFDFCMFLRGTTHIFYLQKYIELDNMAQAFNASIQESKTVQTMSLKSALYSQWVSRRLVLYNENMFQKVNKQKYTKHVILILLCLQTRNKM